MLVEIVNLLGPPSLDDLKQMNLKLEETDDDDEDDHETNLKNEIHEDRYDASSLVELILSIRTFKTYQERLKEKLEHTISGSQAVPKEIMTLIFQSLQYVSHDRAPNAIDLDGALSVEE